ncbi:MAG: molybdopterin-dependent oxidoreductase [Thermodesulfovibrionales bacterium]
MIEFTINDRKVCVEPETTILQAALNNGVYIPHLCYDSRLEPYGGCRLCVVEVEGQRRLMAACSTPAENGMVVHTETPKLHKARKTVLELLLIHHPLDCPICDRAGECSLQDFAFKYGPSESRFVGERRHEPESIAAPLVERNPNRCILCGKCVRVCRDHQGIGAINLIGRGFRSKVSPAFEETLNCEFCGQCIDACPVGALGSKPYRFRSRVWFMDEHEIVCPYCGCGCTTTVSLREGRILRARGKEGVGISKGDLCGKGRFGFDFLYSENRLSTPMLRKDGKLQPVSWEDALEYTVKRLTEIKESYGADAIGAIGSQRCTIEDNYMLQKFMRGVIGSNNIDSAARFGYARAQSAIQKAFGLNTLPIQYDSPLKADIILVIESDVTSTHPVFGLNILRARRQGATLIVADPKETKLSRHADEWLRIKPATSVALLNGLMKAMLDSGLYDKTASNIPNFDSLRDLLSDYTPERTSEITGISADSIANAARVFASAKRRLICITLGGSENTKSTGAVLSAANLLLLSGEGPDALQVPAEFCNTLGLFEVGVRPDKGPCHSEVKVSGMSAGEMFYYDSGIKALYVMGENPLVTFPDVNRVEDMMKGLELLIVQDIMLTDTAKIAHVVLPASSWAEKDGTFVGATGIPQRIRKIVAETGLSIPDWKILRNLSRVMGRDIGARDVQELSSEIKGFCDFRYTSSNYAPAFNPVSYRGGEVPDREFPLLMVTGNLVQHSGSLSYLSKSLESAVADAYLQISREDAKRHRVHDEGFVKVTSRRGSVYVKARVSDEVPEGMLFVPAHFPHAKVNALTHPPLDGEPPTDAVKIEAWRGGVNGT